MQQTAQTPAVQPADETLIDTPHGPARAFVHRVAGAVGGLVLGHGAGGGVSAPDLVAVTAAATEPASPSRSSSSRTAWPGAARPRPHGSSMRPGRPCSPSCARPAGRRARGDRRALVGRPRRLPDGRRDRCLRRPVPCVPARAAAAAQRHRAPPSRIGELEAVTVPVLVVQGTGDRFGMPPSAPGRTVVQVAGDHALRSDRKAVAGAAREWLVGLLSP